jgi:ribosome-associated protein
LTAEQKISIALKALSEKKAEELFCVEVAELTSLTEYFIMATAGSSTHVKSLAEEAEFKLEQQGCKPKSVEGRATDWILLDYGDLIIHIFGRKSKEFYALDKMWSDGNIIDVEKMIESGN